MTRPSRMTTTRSAMPIDLGQLRADHQDGDAAVGEPADDPVDFDLGADIDAARRLVEDQDACRQCAPTREQDLLLVAAGQVGTERARGGDPGGADLLQGRSFSRPASMDPRALTAPSVRAHDVGGTDRLQNEPSRLRSSVSRPTPRRSHGRRCGCAPFRRRARSRRISCGGCRRSHGASSVRPAPTMPAEPEDLARAHLEGDVAHLLPGRRDVSTLERCRSDHAAAGGFRETCPAAAGRPSCGSAPSRSMSATARVPTTCRPSEPSRGRRSRRSPRAGARYRRGDAAIAQAGACWRTGSSPRVRKSPPSARRGR